MKKLHYSVKINAPVQKVWETMLADQTYRIWTKIFNEHGSYFEGDWNEGSDIRFIGPDADGNLGGMVSKIKENKLHKFVSIEHLGQINNGVEDMSKTEWTGAHENYTFIANDQETEVLVDIDMPQNFVEYMDEQWPKALEKLKELCEK